MKCYYKKNLKCDNECLWNGIGEPKGYANEDCSNKQPKDMNADNYSNLSPFWMTVLLVVIIILIAI